MKKTLRIGFVMLSVLILAATLYLLLIPAPGGQSLPTEENLTQPTAPAIKPFGGLLDRWTGGSGASSRSGSIGVFNRF